MHAYSSSRPALSRAAVRACEDKKRHGGSENLLICRCIPRLEGPRYACVSEHERCAGRRHEAHVRAHS